MIDEQKLFIQINKIQSGLFPVTVKGMVLELKTLIDAFKSLYLKTGTDPTIRSIIESTKKLKKAEPKNFQKAASYIHKYRRTLLTQILKQ